jgi:hypothetical protein
MGTRIWDRFLTEQDKAHLALRQHHPIGLGQRPALLLIDLYRWVFGDQPQPLLEAIQTWPASLGIGATARVFEVEAHPVLNWLVEAAEQLRAFAASCLCDLHVEQVPLDELYAVLRDLKAGASSAGEALERLERAPDGVWTAMEPPNKWLLVIGGGPRTVEMAQRVGQQVVPRLAPGGVPRWVPDGLTDYGTAFFAQGGQWMQPARCRDKGPVPQSRWVPAPELLYAQVVKSCRRRRLGGVTYRGSYGTMARVQQGLAACGRPINTALVERLDLDIRQRVAAVGRRVTTLCQGEDGIRPQLTVDHAYDHFWWPHSSVRQPLPVPAPTHGRGPAQWWRPGTPAMAAGLTEHVWLRQEVLL